MLESMRLAMRSVWVRSSFYRQQHPAPVAEPRPRPARALSAAERETVLTHLHEERFQDRSPAAVQATLLDEGVYPLLDSDHVPDLGRARRNTRTPGTADSPRLSKTRVTGEGAQ